MQIVTVQRDVAVPPEAVFDWLLEAQSYGLVSRSRRGRLIVAGTAGRNGVGAVREIIRWCTCRRQRIVYYDRPREFRYEVIEPNRTFRHDGASVLIRSALGGTEVVWSSAFEIAPVPGATLASRAVAALLRREFDSVIQAAEADLIRAGELLRNRD